MLDLNKEKADKIYDTFNTYLEHMKPLKDNYYLLYIVVKGSQNYNLDRETSDLDTLCVVIPKFDTVLDRGTYFSKVYSLEDGSKIEVKDIYSFVDLIAKGSPNSWEFLTSPYAMGTKEFYSFLDKIIPYATESFFPNFQNALKGISHKLFLTFNFEGTAHKEEVATYGYRVKNLVALERLKLMYQKILSKEKICDIYVCSKKEREQLLDYYKNPLSKEKAMAKAVGVYRELTELINSTTVKKDLGLYKKQYEAARQEAKELMKVMILREQ